MHTKTIWHGLLLILSIAILTMTITTFMEVQKGHAVIYDEVMNEEERMEETEVETIETELTSLLVETTKLGDYAIPFGAAEIIGELTLTTTSTPNLLINEDNEGEFVSMEEEQYEETCLAMIVHEAPAILYNELKEREMFQKNIEGKPLVLLGTFDESTPKPTGETHSYITHVTPLQEGLDAWGCSAQNIFTDYRPIN